MTRPIDQLSATYVVTFQRPSKPGLTTVVRQVRQETGHVGSIQVVAYRRRPAQYESPYWEFKCILGPAGP